MSGPAVATPSFKRKQCAESRFLPELPAGQYSSPRTISVPLTGISGAYFQPRLVCQKEPLLKPLGFEHPGLQAFKAKSSMCLSYKNPQCNRSSSIDSTAHGYNLSITAPYCIQALGICECIQGSCALFLEHRVFWTDPRRSPPARPYPATVAAEFRFQQPYGLPL